MPEMKPATAGAQYTVPPEPSRGPAIALAVLMHAVLLGFLWIGVSWQRTVPVAVEAEVWDMKVQSAAAPPLPPPVVEPAPQPEPQPPEPVPVPKVAPPPIEQPVAPKPPDIALEREREREKREQLKKEADRRELAEQKKRDDKRKLDEEKKRDDAARLLEEKKQREADKKLKEQEDKKKADKAAADKKKADLAKAAKEAAAEDAKLDKLRDAEMKRIAGAAGAAGTAAKSTAPRNDASYQAALTAKIKSTTTYAGSTDVPGNPRAEFRIEQLPTGEIMSVKKVKSSGVPSFDDAVEKGIIKSSPLPKKKDGTVERSVLVGFSMKDLD